MVQIVIAGGSQTADWLRKSITLSMYLGSSGGANIYAYIGMLTHYLLEDGAVRKVLHDDADAKLL